MTSTKKGKEFLSKKQILAIEVGLNDIKTKNSYSDGEVKIMTKIRYTKLFK